jgi:hypothetical protein
MLISIPVSRFSYKIIKNRYPDAIIKLTANDALTAQLSIIRLGDDLKVTRLKSILTETVTFDLNTTYAAAIKNVWRVGFHLHRYHREQLDNHVQSLVAVGHERKATIESWCNANNVEPDVDVNIDTLYRHSSRFFERQKQANISRFRKRVVLQNGKNKKVDSLYSDDELQGIATYYEETFHNYFLTTKKRKNTRLAQQLRVYVFRKVGGRPPQYISKLFAITQRTMRYQVSAFSNFLLTAPSLVLSDCLQKQ